MTSLSHVFRVARTISSFIKGLGNMVVAKLVFLFGLGAFLSCGLGWSCGLTTLVVAVVHLITGGWRYAKVVVRTLPRDFRALMVLLAMRWNVRKHQRSNSSIPKLFASTLARFPNKPCFMFEDKIWTYQDVDQCSNTIGNYFYESGVREGDVVAICLDNRPEVVFYWLGLAKIGAIGALVNYNLRGHVLTHCIHAAHTHVIVYNSEMADAIRDIQGDLPPHCQLYYTGQGTSEIANAILLDPLLRKSPAYTPPAPNTKFTGKLFYVFTSGTTGLPKAAVMSHSRFYYMTTAVNKMLHITPADVNYNPLPLYHTAGGVIGVGQALLHGTTVVIKKKFSASKFWDDCIFYNATVGQYIGEICRYLMAQPVRPAETQHRVRVMYGNGLQAQLWTDFQQRFHVDLMGEFYGATEGNCNIINNVNKVGAVGYTSLIAPFVYPVTLVKVDEENNIMRDRNGVCIRAQPGEPGELVGKIVLGDPFRAFDGYVSREASEKKVARDVFRKGDMAFLTGDVLVMDQDGYMFFRDRTGDTFRWRGENVSTSEVETIISKIIKLNTAVVYGVEVPGTEGRAGMATIVDVSETLDLYELNRELKRTLPPYARPVFIRLTGRDINETGTFKLIKTHLKKDGFHPDSVNSDRLFYMNPKTGQYESLTSDVYTAISSGTIRL